MNLFPKSTYSVKFGTCAPQWHLVRHYLITSLFILKIHALILPPIRCQPRQSGQTRHLGTAAERPGLQLASQLINPTQLRNRHGKAGTVGRKHGNCIVVISEVDGTEWNLTRCPATLLPRIDRYFRTSLPNSSGGRHHFVDRAQTQGLELI